MKQKTCWRLINSGPGSAAWNMAVDEALLTLSSGGSQPVLRFFSWERPSLSIGSFQGTDEIDLGKLTAGDIPLVRRPTGGRAVLHASEITYSVTCPIPSEYFPSDLMGSYKAIGACFLEGLNILGVRASLLPASKNPDRKKKRADGRDPLCFSSPSWYEVLADGRKLIGSAQRRLKGAFLQQGSLIIEPETEALARLLLYPDETSRSRAMEVLALKMTSLSDLNITCSPNEIQNAIAAGFEKTLGTNLEPGMLTNEETLAAERLMEVKYATEAWNLHRRA